MLRVVGCDDGADALGGIGIGNRVAADISTGVVRDCWFLGCMSRKLWVVVLVRIMNVW